MSELPTTKEGRIVSGEKSTALSVILNILLPGLGTIYAGKTQEGLIFLLASLVIGFLECLEFFLLISTNTYDIAMFYLFLIIVCEIGYIAIFIYSIYRGVILCKENNTLWQNYLTNK